MMRALVILVPALFLLGADACQEPAAPPAPEAAQGVDQELEREAALGAAPADAGRRPPPILPPQQGVTGPKRILLDPPQPGPGEAVKVRAGPITFTDGCQGIASTEVRREEGRIEVLWVPKKVPPDAMCTMALHDEWVEATIEGLPVGAYEVQVREVGVARFTVAPEE